MKKNLLFVMLVLAKTIVFSQSGSPYLTITGEQNPCPGIPYIYQLTFSGCTPGLIQLGNANDGTKISVRQGPGYTFIVTWDYITFNNGQANLSFNTTCSGGTTTYTDVYSVNIKPMPSPANLSISSTAGNSGTIFTYPSIFLGGGFYGSKFYNLTGAIGAASYSWSITNSSVFSITNYTLNEISVSSIANRPEYTILTATISSNGCSVSKSLDILSLPKYIYPLSNKFNEKQNQNKTSQIKIYPNPASQLVNIQSLITGKNFKDLSITICDLNGQVVKSYNNINLNPSTTLDISDLKNSTYYIKIYNKKEKLHFYYDKITILK